MRAREPAGRAARGAVSLDVSPCGGQDAPGLVVAALTSREGCVCRFNRFAVVLGQESAVMCCGVYPAASGRVGWAERGERRRDSRV